MAKIHVERFLDQFDVAIRRAMDSALSMEAAEAEIDASSLARTFKRALVRRLNTWENVPTNAIEED